MAISKAQRARVFALFDGKCAYCGHPLPERWHIDHLEPVQRDLKLVRGERSWKLVTGAPLRPERDVPENYMPACPPCNIDKHAMSLEAWRVKLQRTCKVLTDNYPTYRHAVRFGLAVETGAKIVFHFERVSGIAPQSESQQHSNGESND